MTRSASDFTTPTPNIFILGAPKCGTTALASYLAEHPEVYVSEPKEPSFFCRDVYPTGAVVNSIDDYVSKCFPGADPDRHKAIVDATVFNLYSPNAVPEILAFRPDAKFIVMLRNPVTLVHSFHSQSVFQEWDKYPSLRDSWAAIPLRRRGETDERPTDLALLCYDDLARLGEQVNRLFRQVPRERVHVVLFDDFQSDTKAAYRAVLRFLGVDPGHEPELRKVNKSAYLKNPLVARLARSPLAKHAAAILRQLLGVKSLGIGRPAAALDPADRRMLTEYFAPDIDLLADAIGRDLSGWKQLAPSR